VKAPNNHRDLKKLVLATIRGPGWKPGQAVVPRASAAPAAAPPAREPQPQICRHCAQTFHPWIARHAEHHARAHHMPMTRLADKAKRWRR
jgi:hypothetical protein